MSDVSTLLEYAMQIAHERELEVLGKSHDSVGAIERFNAAAVRAAPAAAPSQPDLPKQESLGEPFDKVLHDNLWSLYTAEPTQAGVQWQCGPQTSGFTQPNPHAQELTAYEITVGNLRAEIAALRCAGAGLANCAFNIAQWAGKTLTPDVCASLDKCRREWDDATHALRTGGKPC